MFTTYILYSTKLNKFYTGQTEDIGRRLEEHNRGKTNFTRNGSPWILVFTIEFDNRVDAVALEKKIKKRGAGRFLQDNGIEVR